MRDRLEAIGGVLAVTSESGAGTTVTGRVPASLLALEVDPATVERILEI